METSTLVITWYKCQNIPEAFKEKSSSLVVKALIALKLHIFKVGVGLNNHPGLNGVNPIQTGEWLACETHADFEDV